MNLHTKTEGHFETLGGIIASYPKKIILFILLLSAFFLFPTYLLLPLILLPKVSYIRPCLSSL